MLLDLTDLSSEPLHSQISRQLRAKVLAGHLAASEPLSSIRGLAREQKVSVITVQRAYDDLEREGIIRARRGKGFFVVALSEERKRTMAEDRFCEALAKLLDEARDEGLNREQLMAVFEGLLAKAGEAK